VAAKSGVLSRIPGSPKRASLAMNVEVRAVAASRVNSYSVSPIRADARLQESGALSYAKQHLHHVGAEDDSGADPREDRRLLVRSHPATRSGVALRGPAL
jgi:hypothetical protein